MLQIGLKVDLSKLRVGFNDVRRKQVPYATSLMLTAVAGHVGEAWQDEEKRRLDRPTPFTLGGVAVIPARKTRLVATVLVKDIAAEYLAPFVVGGVHALGKKRAILAPFVVGGVHALGKKRAILAPKNNLPLNQYGNLPRGKLATLKARKNVYVGPIRLKSGQVVSGAWQRQAAKPGHKGGALKLLIRFSDPLPVHPVLRFNDRAEAAVRTWAAPEFAKAWAKANATAR